SEKTIEAQFAEKEPYFEVNILEYDEEIIEGEELNISIEITNTGEATGTQTVILREGEDIETVLDSQEITLDEGESQEITLTWKTEENDSGNQTLAIATDNDEEQLDITVSTSLEESTTIGGLVVGALANPAVGAVILMALIILSLGYYKRESIKQRLSENLAKPEKEE
ncbi:MAG: CARDB domain-containing protein, partial [archaeon]